MVEWRVWRKVVFREVVLAERGDVGEGGEVICRIPRAIGGRAWKL